MGEVNNIVCDYLSTPGYYADFWNGTVFRGKRKIKFWQLSRHEKEYYKSKNKKGKTTNVRRDVQMRCKGRKDVLLGVEVMSILDYTMPVRIMDYNVQELQRQIRDSRLKNRQERKSRENSSSSKSLSGVFLYGLKKTDKLLPIHTIGLYCGEDAYDGAKGILDMMDTEGLGQDYRKLLTDYKVKIYNLKDLQEENYETSLREIIAIFKRSKDREAMKEYYRANKERFRQMVELSVETMGVLIGKRTLKLFPQEGGGVDMCKAFEDERAEGRAEGELIGRQKGEESGREKGVFSTLCELVQKGLLKIEDAAQHVNMPVEVFRSKMEQM